MSENINIMAGIPPELIQRVMAGEPLADVIKDVPPDLLASLLGQGNGAAHKDVIDAEDHHPASRSDVLGETFSGGSPAEVDNGEGTNQDRLNEIGRELGKLLGEMPGTALGITILPGGRKVEVAIYYPESSANPEEIVSNKRASVVRFGDALAVVFDEASEIVFEDDDDDDLDDMEPEGEEAEEVDEEYEDEEEEVEPEEPRRRSVRRRR